MPPNLRVPPDGGAQRGRGVSLSDPDDPDHAHLPGCGFRPDCVRLP